MKKCKKIPIDSEKQINLFEMKKGFINQIFFTDLLIGLWHCY